MDDEGTPLAADVNPAEAQATVAETGTPAPVADTPDIDRLVSDVEKHWDKIPAEKRAALDRHFQPAFNRKLNLLNDSINASLRNVTETSGVVIPEGKTPLDLLTENDGKGFTDMLRGVVAKEFAPVKAQITQAEQNQIIQGSIARLTKDHPDLAPHVTKAAQIIDGDPDLSFLAQQGGYKASYYVMQGVAGLLDNEAKSARIKELEGILGKSNIAKKTAAGTTRAGAGAPKTSQTEKPTGKTEAEQIKSAAMIAMARIKADLEAEG